MKSKHLKIITFFLISVFYIVSCVENHVMPEIGKIFITSDPIGAQIYLDNVKTNKITPDTLSNLLADDYLISLKLTEFKDTTFNVTLGNNSNIQKDIYLFESNPKGKISLSTTPSGAQIFLDDVNTGKVTPESINNLPRGSYSILLKLALYDDVIQQITVKKNEVVTKNINMPIAGTSATLVVTSSPSGALITLNGENTNKITPFTFKPLTPGDYSIKLSLLNYRDTSATVTLNSSETKTENINLTLYEPRGSISLSSNPSGAQIFLDNVNTQLETPNRINKLEAGDYQITLKLPGYFDSTFTVVVLADQNTNFPLVNLREIPELGDLVVNSDPIGASIFIDNNDTGYKTPHTFEKLIAGSYSLTLKLVDFADTTFNITIVDKQITNTGEILLTDISPPASVSIDYVVNSSQQLIFSFIFNQDIRFEKVDIQLPDGSLKTQIYNNQYIPKDRKIDYAYPEKISGIWTFTFYGNKVAGRAASFQFSETKKVE